MKMLLLYLTLVLGILSVTKSASSNPAGLGTAPNRSNRLEPNVVLGAINPFRTFQGVAHVANGVSLRNRASGGIELSGLPPSATIVAAYLYWGWTSLSTPTLGKHNRINLNGTVFTGTLVGQGPDACWRGNKNFVYRAAVTAKVTRNGSYKVTLIPGSSGITNGSNAWTNFTAPLAEGASLVVLFREPSAKTFIYDKDLAGNMFIGSISYTLSGFSSGSGKKEWTSISGDGQVGNGVLDVAAAANETTRLNGTILSGPGGVNSSSDWNGSDGNPLNQLWDTRTHDVTAFITSGQTGATVAVTSPTGQNDCLIPVANVLTTR